MRKVLFASCIIAYWYFHPCVHLLKYFHYPVIRIHPLQASSGARQPAAQPPAPTFDLQQPTDSVNNKTMVALIRIPTSAMRLKRRFSSITRSTSWDICLSKSCNEVMSKTREALRISKSTFANSAANRTASRRRSSSSWSHASERYLSYGRAHLVLLGTGSLHSLKRFNHVLFLLTYAGQFIVSKSTIHAPQLPYLWHQFHDLLRNTTSWCI